MNEQILVDINELSPIRPRYTNGYTWAEYRSLRRAARCVSAARSEARRPCLWCGLAGACLCAGKRFSNGCCFWSVRNERSHMPAISPPITLIKTGKKLQIDDGF